MDPITKNLNERQLEAVNHFTGPLLVVAGAGSGKTLVLTRRVAKLIQSGVHPGNILAVTFTNKAAKEMQERISGLVDNQLPSKPLVGTFHSIGARMLRREIVNIDRKSDFTIFDSDDTLALVRQICKDLSIPKDRYHPKAILGHISRAKNLLLDSKSYSLTTENIFAEKVAEVFKQYEKRLLKMNAVDFDDLLVIPVKILSDFPEIRDYYQESWRFLLVDEYQDTNKVQNRFIKLLAEKYTNVCAIGDADQAIYSFRGANPENILQFSTNYPKTKTVKLEQNYRSTQTILAAANAVIENNSSRLEKKMFSAGAEGQKIKLKECSHEREEAFFVMEEIFRLKSERGYDFQDFTLLYRTNVQSRVLEEAALRYSIPYQIVGGLKFYARKEIKDLLAYLRLIANSVDTVSFLRIVNVPTRKVGKVTLGRLENYAVSKGLELPEILRHLEMVEGITKLAKANLIKLAKKIADLRQKSTSVPVSQLVETVIKEFDLENYYRDGTEEGEMRFENIQELISVAQKFDGSDSSLALFLEEVALITDADSVDDKQDRITLMTMHNAKGLEFKVVFLVGAEENILPHSRSMGTFEGLEEERRLFYVAMTRAMERLYITNARTRMIFGDYSANIASRFLTELPDDYLENMSKNQSSSIEEDISLTPIYEDFYPDLVLDFEEAEEVEHSVFGSGVIEKIEGDILTINFGSFGTKRMAASIAPLRKK